MTFNIPRQQDAKPKVMVFFAFVKAWEACPGGLKTLSNFTSSEVEKH
jgi:hypothetical protein